jgi:hypothetical protein
MRKHSRTIQKAVFISVVICLLLWGIGNLLDFGIFSQKNQTVFAQFDASLVASNVNSQCKDHVSNSCFNKFFANFAKSNKFENTKSVLDELIKINKSVSHCHSIAHEISIAEVEKDPQNWLNVFSYVPGDECSAGFFHGVIEGKFQTDPDLIVDASLVNNVCNKQLPNITQDSIRRCAHAFGHIIMLQVEGNVKKSVEECQKVDNQIKSPCFQGVFMEHIQKDNLTEHGIEVRPDWNKKYVDVEKRSCELYKDQEQIECWRSLAPAILKASNSDHLVAVRQCNEASLALSRKACNREVLGRLLVDSLSSQAEIEEDYCQSFKTKAGYEECLKDILNYALLTSLQYKDQMENYCFKIPQDSRNTCLQTLKKYI